MIKEIIKQIKLFTILIVSLFLLSFLIKELYYFSQAKHKLLSTKQQFTNLLEENKKLKQQIALLRNTKQAIKKARSQFNLPKENEKVLVLLDLPTSSPPKTLKESTKKNFLNTYLKKIFELLK